MLLVFLLLFFLSVMSVFAVPPLRFAFAVAAAAAVALGLLPLPLSLLLRFLLLALKRRTNSQFVWL